MRFYLARDVRGQFKDRLITSYRNLQANLIIPALVQIILLKPFADVVGGDADDGVLRGAVAVAALINLKPDQMLVYLLGPARQVIVADQLHKFPLLGRLGKMFAVQYPIQRPLDLFRRDRKADLCRGLMFCNESLLHRASLGKSLGSAGILAYLLQSVNLY